MARVCKSLRFWPNNWTTAQTGPSADPTRTLNFPPAGTFVPEHWKKRSIGASSTAACGRKSRNG